MEVDAASPLDTLKVNCRVPSEKGRLVGTGDVHLLDDAAVQVGLEEDLVALRYEIPRQPHAGRRCCGGGREGRSGCRVHRRDLIVVKNDHGDNAADDSEGQQDKGGGDDLGFVVIFRHAGCSLCSVLKVLR